MIIKIPRPEDANTIVSVEGHNKGQVDDVEKAIEGLLRMEVRKFPRVAETSISDTLSLLHADRS